MDDECCVMEEKSLLGRFYASRKRGVSSRLDENDGLSEYSRSESLSRTSWLPDGLRRRMSQRNSEDIETGQTYPVMDWLKQIRLSCDLYDAGLPTKNNPESETALRDENWSSSEESVDWNDVEETNIDDVTNILSGTNDESRAVHYENNLCRIDNLLQAEEESELECENDRRTIDDQEERGEEIEYDGSGGGKEETCLGRATFDRIYGSLTSATNASSTTCCFEPKPKNGNCSGLSRSLELSGLLFCADDDLTLSYCDRFEDEKSEEMLDGLCGTSESSTEEIGASSGFEGEVCPYGSLEMNLNCEDEPFASDLEIDESCFGATRFCENYGSAWTERFDDRGLHEERLGERFCVSCDRYDCEKYLSKGYENSELSDSATLEENLDREERSEKTTVPVAHWVATFNNFDGVRRSTESTERTAVHTFNIFDGRNDDEGPCEFSDDYSEGFSDTENGADAGVGPIELSESVEESENVKEYRRRKGSVSSDVVEWKKNLWDMFIDDEECGDEVRLGALSDAQLFSA